MSAVAFDRLGHGESDGDFRAITISDEIEQVRRMIGWAGDQAGGPVHVVAHSLGAVEAAKAAAADPHAVASLTLWAPAAAFSDEIAGDQIQGPSLDPLYETGTFDFRGQALGRAFVDDARGVDPYAGLQAYGRPAHIHHGEADEIVDISYGRRYADLWGEQATFTPYPGAGHTWADLDARTALLDRTVRAVLGGAP